MEKVTKTLFLVVLLACIFVFNAYAAEPIPINNANDLNNIRNNLAGSYILMSDIDLSNTVWGEVYAGEYGTSGWEPIGTSATPFTGAFDGNDHSISGLFINLPDDNNIGLFGYVKSSNIHNLGLGGVNVTGNMSVGGLVGYNEGTITNCHTTGSVKGTADQIGGLVGYHHSVGTITNSYSACAVEGTHLLGGLIGRNEAPISNSYATGDVYGILAGTSSAVGGLVGRNADSIINSYATGNVTGSSSVGGLIGFNWSEMDIEYSYATGAVEGTTYPGGLIGRIMGTGTVLNSYYNSCTTGQSDTLRGEPKDSTAMVQAATFIGWDFINIWNIYEGESYPCLRWSSHVPAPPAATEVTGIPDSIELTYGGGSTTLTAAVLPECAIQTVTWSTNNPDVATVDANGVVTPIGVGAATITASPVSGDVVGETVVTVAEKELTVSGSFTAESKVYDGSTTAVINASSLTLSGIVGEDDVVLSTSAVFADKNAADGITVNLTSDNSLTGVDAGNYTLSLTDAPTSTANITVKGLTVINAAAQDKVYDGNAEADIINAALSGVVDGDDVTLGNHTVGTFAQAAIGLDIGVTTNMTIAGAAVGNYTLAQPVLAADITTKGLTVINAEAQDKIYDGTVSADIINAALSGVVDGDAVTLTNHTGGAFAQATVGTDIGVTTNMTITGVDAGNYTIAQPALSADITAKSLTVGGTFTAVNKVYDGNTTVVIDDSGLELTGVVVGDSVILNATATFADKNVADNIVVSLTGSSSISGEDSGNYSLSLAGADTGTANITAKELTIINAAAQDKIYDGVAAADIINAELSGVVDGDSVTLGDHTMGVFAQATVGTDIVVTANMTITGVDAGNYTIAQPALSADIAAKSLTVGGTFTAVNKIYDGNTTVIIDDSDLELTGVVDGDSVTLNAAAAFADANVADNIVVSLTDASSISGGDSGNYSLSLAGAPTTTANITPPPSNSKAIIDFSLEAFEPDIQAVIDEGEKTITMEVPFGTDVTALVPTIEHTGIDIIPSSGIVQDFTNPVTYEVTAENSTTAVYMVTINVALPSNEARLNNLVISSGTLNPVFVPDIQAYTADVANSTADITVTPTAAHPGALIEVNMTAVASGEASQIIALNVGANIINIKVTAEDGTERIYQVTVNRASSESSRDRDNDRNTSISEPEPTAASNITININGNSITSAASMDSGTGTVTAVLDEGDINNALTESQTDEQGVSTIDIEIPKTTGANYYVTELPTTVLTGDNSTRIEINSELGTITLPGNMLGNEGVYGTDNVGLSIGTVDKSAIDEKARTQIGDKPIIELKLISKTGTISWNNPDAPVTVSMPYTPTEKELSDPEHITVWYIDGEGNVIEVPSGRYNPATGMVTFSTTHFSNYAVVYVTKTFDDLENVTWAKKSIEVLASKGILKGITEKEYDPQSNITRADFLYSLIRTLGVEAKLDGNFDDISKDDYYYKEIGIAQKLGITKGTGNNKFNPGSSITRQDMMVLTERALRMLKRIEAQGKASDLDKFADKSLVAVYAENSVAAVVKEGLIIGNDDNINPLGNTTRGETAVFLYRIYNQ